ncbi:restriction endonuclease subunit S [Acinetobacter terrae]|uniref:Restriction endonuclease subunit S n=1 Tax=Acinetobacter terrae TaxID=2731247 RepID=A0A4R0EKP6_9GAMM|nr:restriction endonuclease subunit S [Acinetobacter terrae]TCB57846.1 restriction endonuclease subunit S [Acinetobacter terrae]
MTAPKLRFKEFDGDWLPYVLKDFVSFRKGKGISKADISEDGINECIRYGELYTTYGQVIRKIQSKTYVSKSECVLSQAGDVLIPASGETQIDIATASCVLKGDVILSGDLNILSHKENGEWLAYYLSSAKKLDIAQLAQGNSVVHLYSSQLKDLKINKPSKAEQTKIASFLSAVDEKISQLTKKHQLLSQYKQGMMQKLFSQQLRFKADDGSEFGEWEEILVQYLVDKGILEKPMDGNHGEIHPTSKDYVEEGIPFVMATDIFNGKLHLEQTKKLTKQQADSLRKGFSREGDVLLTHKANIGNVAIVPQLDVEYLMLTPQVTYYRVINFSRLNNNFLKVYFESPQFQKNLLDLCTGATRLYIGISEQRKLPISLPCLEEQTKIANFLSAIDQKIEVVAQQIEQAKTWKKGLLQQMFV